MLSADVDEQLMSVRQGGTGTTSESDQQPTSSPEKLESGNHNAPGLCGLAAALDWFDAAEFTTICEQIQQKTARLLYGLKSLAGLQVFGADDPQDNVGVMSVAIPGMDPHELSTILDQAFQIETRAGLHCAPKAHEALGTLAAGGTVRLSPGHFSTADDIDAAVHALREISGA